MSGLTKPYVFIAEATALDFLNTRPFAAERLENGADLLAWLEAAELVPRPVLARMRKTVRRDELNAVAARARALRSWFREFVVEFKGANAPADALGRLGPLNDLLSRDEAFEEIVARDDGGLDLEVSRRWRSPESLLFPIGQAMAALICEGDLPNVKACEGAECVLLFVDRSRGRGRRWCSMTNCGNRAKQAAYRSRRPRD